MVPKKIYIVGPSGSGKTTLGKTLSKEYKLPHFELDRIAYPNQVEKPMDQRLQDISTLAKKPVWVTEGIYVSWTKELFEKADLIIWLDLPLHKTLIRVLKRFAVHRLRGDEKFGIKNTLKFTFNLRKYYFPKKGEEEGTEEKQTTRAKTQKALKEYMGKVVRIKSASELNKFLSRVKNLESRNGIVNRYTVSRPVS